jgi:hypothetical protein
MANNPFFFNHPRGYYGCRSRTGRLSVLARYYDVVCDAEGERKRSKEANGRNLVVSSIWFCAPFYLEIWSVGRRTDSFFSSFVFGKCGRGLSVARRLTWPMTKILSRVPGYWDRGSVNLDFETQRLKT